MNLSLPKHDYKNQETQIFTQSSPTTQPKRDSGFWPDARAKAMGLLLVFFPEDTSPIADKPNLFSSPSSSPPHSSSSLKRPNSIRIFSTAQCIIFVCALLLFSTLVLFTLSTIEPTAHRRFLSQKSPTIHNPATEPRASDWFSKLGRTQFSKCASKSEHFPSPALQRMGTLYRRGTRAMKDLVVGHVVADTTDEEFRLFLRVLHRSALTASADVVFMFDSASLSSRFNPIIQEENDSFFSLLQHYAQMMNVTQHHKNRKQSHNFDVTKFFKMVKRGAEIEEPLWGKRTRSNLTNPETRNDQSEESVPLLSYGSVLRFDPEELDPEHSLAGFLDSVPLSLRRWACYPMLLGRVKRNFKHIMLVDVKKMVVVKDPLGRVRNRSPESILLHRDPESSSSSMTQSRNSSEKTLAGGRVNSAIIMGGGRGIRRLSNAMLTEIVRWAMKKRTKNSVTESVVLSQLVWNKFTMKNVNLITLNESISDTRSVADPSSASSTSLWDYVIIQRDLVQVLCL
ncbi:uncharacterized protein LOC129306870 isoform X2 [Prosopis cineraria]|uniref:uncharacterized protein LOC129306870 isoform X2 n=1 Tax=Prosopis cineraria TaxID=364024 RepID=UPI0024109F22|nr:uncharacterized protein LOC129306870 isoform X2 [Prosopis cineraria]